MPNSPLTPPPQEPYGWRYDIGPGPLSPAWPKAVVPAKPKDEFLALAGELEALQRECWRSLDLERQTGPIWLSRDERARLNGAFAALQEANAGLPHTMRSSAATRWPAPVLPENALFGARDLLAFLGTAIAVAHAASEWRRRVMA